jgi:hypothetical protein
LDYYGKDAVVSEIDDLEAYATFDDRERDYRGRNQRKRQSALAERNRKYIEAARKRDQEIFDRAGLPKGAGQ